MRYNQWYNEGTYFEFDGFQYFYKVEGEGEPLLLIHGFPTSSWDWWKIWPDLIKRYKVIAADMLGFGYSDKPNGYNYTIHHQARMHEALLGHLNIQNVHTLVHDYGNTVMQELLAAMIDRNAMGDNSLNYLSTCFLNGGLFPEMHRPVLTQKLLHSPVGFLFNRFLTRDKLRMNFDKVFGEVKASDEEIDEFYDIMNYKDGRSNMHRLIKYIRDRRQHRERWVNGLQSINVPMRLINGPLDPVSGQHLVDYYQKMIPNPDVVVLDGVGHYPQTEAPERVIEGYLDFRDQREGQ